MDVQMSSSTGPSPVTGLIASVAGGGHGGEPVVWGVRGGADPVDRVGAACSAQPVDGRRAAFFYDAEHDCQDRLKVARCWVGGHAAADRLSIQS